MDEKTIKDNNELIKRIVKRYTTNKEDIEDILSQVYEKIILEKEHKSSLSGWINTVTKNTAIDYLRSKNRRLETFVSIDYDYNMQTASVDEEVDNRLERESIINYIQTFYKEPTLSILKYYFFEDLSYNEIHKRTKVPLGTIKSKINRFRNRLKNFK